MLRKCRPTAAVRVLASRGAATLAVLILVTLPVGCAAPVVEAALIARDQATYQSNLAAAQAGNAEAELKVGNALCCSVSADQPFYNTQRATEFLCRAAIQGNRDAMFRLGRIYDGDTVDGLRAGRRLAAAVADAPLHPVAVWTWFSVAADAGSPDGARRAEQVRTHMSGPQLAQARLLQAAGARAVPCTESDVAHGA